MHEGPLSHGTDWQDNPISIMIHTAPTPNTHTTVLFCLVLKRRNTFYTLMHTLYYY